MKTWFGMFAFLLFFVPSFAEEQSSEAVVSILETLLQATIDNDLEAFESVCDEAMQTAMTPELLKSVNAQLSGLLQAGYQTSFMGVLDRIAFKTYLWKIDLSTEGAADILAELSVKGEKAAGFMLK